MMRTYCILKANLQPLDKTELCYTLRLLIEFLDTINDTLSLGWSQIPKIQPDARDAEMDRCGVSFLRLEE